MTTKMVVKVEQRMHGHVHATFDDGSQKMYERGTAPKVGTVVGQPKEDPRVIEVLDGDTGAGSSEQDVKKKDSEVRSESEED